MGRAVLLLLLVALVMAVPLAVAHAETVTIEIIDRGGNPVAGATVMLCNATRCPWVNTTDSNGVAVLGVPNGTYLLLVNKDKLHVLDVVTVSGDTSVVEDLRNMHYANIESKPISVTIKVTPTTFNRTIELSTPSTLYARMVVNIAFPDKVKAFPYVYSLEKIEYDGNVAENRTAITLGMDKDCNVTAYYSQQFAVSLDTPTLVALVLVVAVATIVAWRAGAKTAKEAVIEWRRRFVKKK